jgi:hypothetical protein
MASNANEVKELGTRWTKDVLRRCTPRELLVIAGEYGLVAVAQRLGYTDVVEFLESGLSNKK